MTIPLRHTTMVTLLTGCLLSSCVYRSNPVPEMPYSPRRQPVVQPQLQPTAPTLPYTTPGTTWVPVSTQPTAPVLHPQPTSPATPAPVVRPVTPVTPTPAPATPRPSSTHITQPTAPVTPTMPPATPAPAVQPPVVSTVTPPTPDAPTATPTDPKLITNTGPIPVATRVEGDPIRVYNPLDPTKTIRIIDPKTGKVHPSGKVLKVKGTNFKFIVP